MTVPLAFDPLLETLCGMQQAQCILTDASWTVRAVTAHPVCGVHPGVGDRLDDLLPELMCMAESVDSTLAAGQDFRLPWINRAGQQGMQYLDLVVQRAPATVGGWVVWLLDTTAEGRMKAKIHERMHAALLGWS